MKETNCFFYAFFKQVLLIVLFLFLIAGLRPAELFAQAPAKPPYGLSEEAWLKMHKLPPANFSRNDNPVINQNEVFINGSFENGDFTGWITQDMNSPYFALQVGGAGMDPGEGLFLSAPVDGDYAAVHGWDGDGPNTIRVAQDVVLPPDAVSVEFDYRTGWNLGDYGAILDRVFSVKVEPAGGGAPLQTETILVAEAGTMVLDSGNLHGSVNVSAFADSSVRISFDWTVPENYAGPAFFQLDNVYVIPVDSGPRISVNPANIDFGLLPVDWSSKPVPVTIRSLGSENLTVSAIADPGSPFTLNNVPGLPLVIPPGGMETFEVTFSPGSVDTFYAAITVNSDDPDIPVRDILLSGEGLVFNPADSGVMYASTGHIDGGNLITVDTGTGGGTLVGSTGMNSVPGLAINSSGEIYAADGDNSNLYIIDAASGRAVLVAKTGLFMLPALAFDSNDILYGLGTDPLDGEWYLYTISTTTGVPTKIGRAGQGIAWRGLSFNPQDGALFASTSGSEVYSIDPANGTPAYIGNAGLSGGLPDIQFDNGGTLYGVAGGNQIGDLVVIDQNTAQPSLIGSVGYSSVSGLAMRPERAGWHTCRSFAA